MQNIREDVVPPTRVLPRRAPAKSNVPRGSFPGRVPRMAPGRTALAAGALALHCIAQCIDSAGVRWRAGVHGSCPGVCGVLFLLFSDP